MAYEFLKLHSRGGIAVLTLNRPDALNAWNQKMRDELCEAVRDLAADDSLRVLVITGEGRAFSAGADVRGMQGLAELGTPGDRRDQRRGCRRRPGARPVLRLSHRGRYREDGISGKQRGTDPRFRRLLA